MAKTLLEKLLVTSQLSVFILDLVAAEGISIDIPDLQDFEFSTKITDLESFDVFLFFIMNLENLAEVMSNLIILEENHRKFWIAYPKMTSKIAKEISLKINRDVIAKKVRESHFRGVSIISIDSTWSALRVRPIP